MLRVRLMCLVAAFGLAFAGIATAQQGPNELPDEKGGAIPDKASAKVLSRRAIGAATVAAIVGGHGQLGDMLILQQSGWTGAWEDHGPSDRPRIPVPLAREMMIGIEQNKPVAFSDNPFEAKTYNYVLTHAHDVDPKELQKEGEKHRDVTRAHLMEQPERYQGEVVHVEGNILRLRKFDAPKSLANDGVKEMYEAWIFPRDRAEPICVVCTHIPKDMVLGDKVSHQVECDGYFFKKYAYKGAEKWLVAPLVVANEIRWPVSPIDNSEFFSAAFIPSVLAGIAAVVLLGVALTFWFRRGDRAVQERLLSLRQPPPAFSDPSFTEDLPAPRE